jgi:glycosyltransferase involved in cell wall biosynthesis
MEVARDVAPNPVTGRQALRIVQAIASIENEAAGTTACVKRLSQALASQGHDVTLVSTGPSKRTREGRLENVSCSVSFPALPIIGRLRFSKDMRAELSAKTPSGSVIHSNGLWLMPNVYPSWVARSHDVPYVVSPHGMLGAAALAFSTFKKRAFDLLLQRSALENATCFHATSFQEADEIRSYGLSAPIAVVPNGIDLPSPFPTLDSGSAVPRTVLYLGRVHPKKGLDRLIDAWARIEREHPDWRLRIVGPSEGGCGQELEAQARGLSLMRVSFEDGLYGALKDAAYREADVFVLPTLNENFAMVVGEALAAGTPVISTKGAPWRSLEEHGCGWWVDHGPEPLAAALTEAMSMPREALAEMGARGREWMRRDFSWEYVAAEMTEVYAWCLGRGDRPVCVRT